MSVVCGKRKWNKYSQSKKIREFITASDEAFAMIVMENNLPKWMEEVRSKVPLRPNEKRRSLYTEEDNNKGW